MEKRDQFTYYRSFQEALTELPDDLRLGVMDAIINYALDGTEPQGLCAMQRMAFRLIRPNLDASRKKAMAGKIGGSRSKANRKQTASKKENENEGEIEKENEIENEIEIEIEDECLRTGFERFWASYPLKIGKDQAWEIWQELQPDADAVCGKVREWNGSHRWYRENGRFIPNPARFLEERYHEQSPPEVPMGGTSPLGKAEIEAIMQIMGEE